MTGGRAGQALRLRVWSERRRTAFPRDAVNVGFQWGGVLPAPQVNCHGPIAAAGRWDGRFPHGPPPIAGALPPIGEFPNSAAESPFVAVLRLRQVVL